MLTLNEAMQEYKQQLEKGTIQVAYRGLLDFMLRLRATFQTNYPEFSVPGSLYFGYMDMTYFSLVPETLKERRLKIAVVFLHEDCRFEVWLSGYNRQIQAKVWDTIKASGWDKYRLVTNPKGSDAVLEQILVSEPDFSDLPKLTSSIEQETIRFVRDVEEYFSRA